MQRIFMKKCFLLMVGSVCPVKWFTNESRNVANVTMGVMKDHHGPYSGDDKCFLGVKSY
jgi:hypothetical protein